MAIYVILQRAEPLSQSNKGNLSLLLSRPEPYRDESLESYMLRLGQANGFEQYSLFVSALNHYISYHELKELTSLPSNLRSLNPCFALRDCGARLRALKVVCTLTALEPLPLLSLAIYRAGKSFSFGTSGVIREGLLYPRKLLNQGQIPICPQCLKEHSYIRQIWHFEPYTSCHIHNTPLVRNCSCGEPIDYLNNGHIGSCPQCGQSYSELHEGDCVDSTQDFISKWLAGDAIEHAPHISQSHRWGLYLWWESYKHNLDSSSSFKSLIEKWPLDFNAFLSEKLMRSQQFSIKPSNELSLSDVFGNLLKDVSKLPSRHLNENIVLKQVYSFLNKTLSQRKHWLSEVRVNSLDTSLILGIPVEQIAALLSQGELTTCLRMKSDHVLHPAESVFRLGDVFNLWLTSFQVEGSNYNVITSAQ